MSQPTFMPAELQHLESRVAALESSQAVASNKMNLLVFSGDRDKLLASFVMATSAAATGCEVTMFFTFWGTAGLKKSKSQIGRKTWVERAFGWMLPGGLQQTKLSKMEMFGMGRWLMSAEMKKKGIADLPQMLELAADLGIKIQVCEMSMELMGIRAEELVNYPKLQLCGATTFVEQATNANTTLFI